MAYKRISLALLLFVLCVGCSAHSVDVDRIVPALSDSWFALQEATLSLHDSGVLKGADWERVQELQAKGSEIMRNVWALWLTEHRISDVDYSAILKLFSDIQRILSGVQSQSGTSYKLDENGCYFDGCNTCCRLEGFDGFLCTGGCVDGTLEGVVN